MNQRVRKRLGFGLAWEFAPFEGREPELDFPLCPRPASGFFLNLFLSVCNFTLYYLHQLDARANTAHRDLIAS